MKTALPEVKWEKIGFSPAKAYRIGSPESNDYHFTQNADFAAIAAKNGYEVAEFIVVESTTPAGYHIMNEAGEVCADRKTLSEARKVVEDWNTNWFIKPYFYGVS